MYKMVAPAITVFLVILLVTFIENAITSSEMTAVPLLSRMPRELLNNVK